MIGIRRHTWVIAEGHLPNRSGETDAHGSITVFFTSRSPAGPCKITVPAERTLHHWFDELSDPEPIPRGVDHASVIVSGVPLVVQHMRLDPSQPANTLLSAVAFAA
ncbi:hypothetical protein Daura_22205 [Dactylosporangium aurantiacum]|uniref:Uncharacterized protein n=1 Tax=Dactylosporangium aurantiacum TaxID=35754 RepID=A0A9Q9IRK6_9ACTN|nr:sensory rhodopsin transducer [Dactylosporangium aurantiacum]MDG6110504.1 sensory rhodopsin transducer [Dactylosporangium aurantiacum]UWZ58640.1 hypothetical protein Daura_22205 [Dactylosporangium aurantiacum]